MRQASCLRLSLFMTLLLAGCLSTPTGVTRRAPAVKKPAPVATPKATPTPAARRAAPPSAFASKAPVALAPSLAPSLPPPLRTRYTTDQPDDFRGYQIHIVYALPQDAPDEQLDRKGTIGKAIDGMNAWLTRNGDGAALRFDTYQGEPDVTFLRLAATDAEVKAHARTAMGAIEDAVADAGLFAPGKVVMVFYGADGVADDERHIGKARQGFGVTFMKSAAGYTLKGSVTGSSLESVMLHEIVHAVGMNDSDGTAHVFDAPNDLMATTATRAPNVLLDLNRDNYFAHGKSGTFDLSRSLLLKQPPANARPPKGWPYSIVPVADGIDPMAKAGLPAVRGDESLETALVQALNDKRTKAGGAALTVTASMQTVARITADEVARGVTAKTINLGQRAGHWGSSTSITLVVPGPADTSPAGIQSLVDRFLGSPTWQTQLLDGEATELAVGAVSAEAKLYVTIAIGKASLDVRRLRIGATPYGVHTFSGEVRALKKLDYPLLYTDNGLSAVSFPVPLSTDWVPFVADVPTDEASSFVSLRIGDRKVTKSMSISWNFDGTKPPGEAMELPSTTYPLLSVPGGLRPIPQPSIFE